MNNYTIRKYEEVTNYTAKQLKDFIDEKIEEFGEDNVEFDCEVGHSYGSEYAKAYVYWTRPMTELEREQADVQKKQREQATREWQLKQYNQLKEQLGL